LAGAAVPIDGLHRDSQGAFDRSSLAGEGQLAHNGKRAGPVEGDLAAVQEQPQGDR
jgi:hypothetical protein